MEDSLLKKISDAGILIRPDAAELVNAGNVDALVEKHRNGQVSREAVLALGVPGLKTAHKKYTAPSGPAGIAAFARYYKKKYDNIAGLLTGKMENLISINKLGLEKSSIIVLAVNVDATGFDACDPTGTIRVQTKERVLAGDVLGLSGTQREGIFFAEKITFPDTPIKDAVSLPEERNVVFVSDIRHGSGQFKEGSWHAFLEWVASGNVDAVVIGGNVSTTNDYDFLKQIPVRVVAIPGPDDAGKFLPQAPPEAGFLPNPSTIFFEEGEKRVEVLVFHAERGVDAQGLLRRRHLTPVNFIPTEEDVFFMEAAPDIFFVGGQEKPSITNYKTTTIITTGSFGGDPTFAVVNLKTREARLINF